MNKIRHRKEGLGRGNWINSGGGRYEVYETKNGFIHYFFMDRGKRHGLFIWIQYRRIIMEKGLFEFAAISSTNPGRVG